MNTDLILAFILILAAVMLVSSLVLAVFAVNNAARVAQEAIAVTKHQSDLLAAGDPLAFQAIAAMSQPAVYDGDTAVDESENLGEPEADLGDLLDGFGDDPFVKGTALT